MTRPESEIIELRDFCKRKVDECEAGLRQNLQQYVKERLENTLHEYFSICKSLDWVLGDDTKIAFGRGIGALKREINRGDRS